MSDREVAMFFKKPILSQSKDGSVCGRFMQDQLDRDIEIPKKRITWLKYFFQIALPAFLVSAKATAQGAVKVKIKNEFIDEKCTQTKGEISPIFKKDIIGDTIIFPVEKKLATTMLYGNVNELYFKTIQIKGSVVDFNTNLAIPNATIRIGNGKIIVADSLGKFDTSAEIILEKTQLEISSVGYETKVVDYISTQSEIIIQLVPQAKNLNEVIVVSPIGVVKGKITMGAYSTVKKQTIIEKIISKDLFSKSTIHLYPNPLNSGSTLNIEWRKNKADNYKLELFNLTGQLIFSKEMWIDEEARLLNIQIPQVAAGNYFLRMTGKTPGKRHTEKIIIQ
jgi:hypothetical protein